MKSVQIAVMVNRNVCVQWGICKPLPPPTHHYASIFMFRFLMFPCFYLNIMLEMIESEMVCVWGVGVGGGGCACMRMCFHIFSECFGTVNIVWQTQLPHCETHTHTHTHTQVYDERHTATKRKVYQPLFTMVAKYRNSMKSTSSKWICIIKSACVIDSF